MPDVTIASVAIWFQARTASPAGGRTGGRRWCAMGRRGGTPPATPASRTRTATTCFFMIPSALLGALRQRLAAALSPTPLPSQRLLTAGLRRPYAGSTPTRRATTMSAIATSGDSDSASVDVRRELVGTEGCTEPARAPAHMLGDGAQPRALPTGGLAQSFRDAAGEDGLGVLASALEHDGDHLEGVRRPRRVPRSCNSLSNSSSAERRPRGRRRGWRPLPLAPAPWRGRLGRERPGRRDRLVGQPQGVPRIAELRHHRSEAGKSVGQEPLASWSGSRHLEGLFEVRTSATGIALGDGEPSEEVVTPPDAGRCSETLVRQQRRPGERAGLVESAPSQHDLHPREVARRQLQGVTHLLGDRLGSAEQPSIRSLPGRPAS